MTFSLCQRSISWRSQSFAVFGPLSIIGSGRPLDAYTATARGDESPSKSATSRASIKSSTSTFLPTVKEYLPLTESP